MVFYHIPIINPTMFSAPMVMDNKVIIAAIAKTTNQIKTFHFMTLVPSNVAKGNRLNAEDGTGHRGVQPGSLAWEILHKPNHTGPGTLRVHPVPLGFLTPRKHPLPPPPTPAPAPTSQKAAPVSGQRPESAEQSEHTAGSPGSLQGECSLPVSGRGRLGLRLSNQLPGNAGCEDHLEGQRILESRAAARRMLCGVSQGTLDRKSVV